MIPGKVDLAVLTPRPGVGQDRSSSSQDQSVEGRSGFGDALDQAGRSHAQNEKVNDQTDSQDSDVGDRLAAKGENASSAETDKNIILAEGQLNTHDGEVDALAEISADMLALVERASASKQKTDVIDTVDVELKELAVDNGDDSQDPDAIGVATSLQSLIVDAEAAVHKVDNGQGKILSAVATDEDIGNVVAFDKKASDAQSKTADKAAPAVNLANLANVADAEKATTLSPAVAAASKQAVDTQVSVRVLRRETHHGTQQAVTTSSQSADVSLSEVKSTTELEAQKSVAERNDKSNAELRTDDARGRRFDVKGANEPQSQINAMGFEQRADVANQVTQRLASTIASEMPKDVGRTVSTTALDMATAKAGTGVLKVVELELQPHDLGKVTLRLSLSDDVLGVTVEAKRHDTAGLLKQEHDRLQGLLQKAGYTIEELIVRQSDGEGVRSTDTTTSAGKSSENQSSGSFSNGAQNQAALEKREQGAQNAWTQQTNAGSEQGLDTGSSGQGSSRSDGSGANIII